ncbi:MAG: hypothetical protein R6X31_13730, partial [Anaerolineae bacterium]
AYSFPHAALARTYIGSTSIDCTPHFHTSYAAVCRGRSARATSRFLKRQQGLRKARVIDQSDAHHYTVTVPQVKRNVSVAACVWCPYQKPASQAPMLAVVV